MTVYDQPVTTYSDTTPHIRVISNIIQLIDPRDTPLIEALGGLDAARSKFRIRQSGTKIELLEDEYDPLASTCNHTQAITTDDTTWAVSDATIFQDGHVILIDNEYMVVKDIDASGNTITVYARDYGGTNDTHATDAAITIVGMARLEGDDADYGPVVDISAPFNYPSIFQKAIRVTGTMQVIDQYGIQDELSYQSRKAVPHLMRLVEGMLFHGIRAAGTASAPRSAGGLPTFITDNYVDASGAIAKSDIDNLAEYIMLDGGNPDLLVVNPSVGNDVKALIDSSSFVRVDQENSRLGMTPITRVSTQYGDLTLLMDRWCPVSKAYMLDSSKIGLYTLRPFASHPLAKTGDSEKWEVIGELSLIIANDKAHGWIYGITS